MSNQHPEHESNRLLSVRAINGITAGVIVFGVVWLALLGLSVSEVLGRSPGTSGGLDAPSESDARAAEALEKFSEEYPGWTVVDTGVRTNTEHTQPMKEYVITAVAPHHEFSVGIVYVSADGRPVNNTDRILRESGPFHTRAESLWEFLDTEYAAQGRTIVAVKTTHNGRVTVEWVNSTATGSAAQRHVIDTAMRDETAHEWRTYR